jgi:serine/threonine protein kinase
MQTYGDWEAIGPLGEGGQGEVFLVRSPERRKERAKCVEGIKDALGLPRENSYLISKLPADEAAQRLSEAITCHARPELPSELGALKLFTKVRMPGPEGEKQVLGRLKTEISVMEKADNPGLLKMLDSNLNQRWIVTEYHPRGTFADHLLKYNGNAAHALKAFRSLVAVVASLHHPGANGISIVHRDIKPTNVFLGKDNQLVLGDFGIVYSPEHTQRLTRTGEAVGPWDYMPPGRRISAWTMFNLTLMFTCWGSFSGVWCPDVYGCCASTTILRKDPNTTSLSNSRAIPSCTL